MCRLFLMTLACLLVLFGISGFWMMPKLIQQKIEQRMQLKIGTRSYDRFVKVPIPLTVKFYLFNVTNSEKVLKGLEAPKFQEVGPFKFTQWRRREVVDFEDSNRLIKYHEFKTYYPILPSSNSASTNTSISNDEGDGSKNLSNSSTILNPYTTSVTLINVPLLAALTKIANLDAGSIKRKFAETVLNRLIQESDEKILVTKTANQFLFDGYKVTLMKSVRTLFSDIGYNFDSPLPNDTFGFFYGKNNTWSKQINGELTVFTGRNESMKDFMLIDNWNNLRTLEVWPKNTKAGNRCNEIRGTDGSQFHPGVTKDKTLDIFTPLVCSSVQIKFKEETEARGIPLLRFTPFQMFTAPKKSVNHACFCTIPPRPANANGSGHITDDRCYKDGIMDLSLCQKGAPVAASFPHFYQGDSHFAIAAGLEPNPAIHETFVDIEPMTGTVMRAASRAQLNAFVEEEALKVIDASIMGSMRAMVAPMLWLEEAAEIDEPSANLFKNQLLSKVQKVRRMIIYAIITGIVLAAAVSVQYWYVTCYSISLDRSSDERTNRPRNERFKSNLRQTTSLQKIRHSKRANEAIDDEDENRKPLTNSVVPVLATAVAFGAASSGPAKRQAKSRRKPNNGPFGKEEEDELNRKLMVNEWNVGQATPNTSSGQSCLGEVDNRGITSENISEDGRRRHIDSDQEVVATLEQERNHESDLTKPGTSSSAYSTESDQ